MRFLLAVLALLAPVQDEDEAPQVRWPTVPATASNAVNFTPRGWVVEAERRGDLNGDGIGDLLLVLHDRARANVVRNEGMGVSELDTNPRLLVVATGRRGGGYVRALVNRTLIPRWINAQVDDAFPEVKDKLAIRHGAFVVPLCFFANAGTWTTFQRQFTFRLQGGRAMLIGFDEQYAHRGSGETRDTSINYPAGVRQVATGFIDEDAPAKAKRSRLPRRRLLTIEQVGDGLAFDPG